MVGLPAVTEAPPLQSADFPDQAPLPVGATPLPAPSASPTPRPVPTPKPAAGPLIGPATSDDTPFTATGFKDVATKTKFKPVFAFTLDASQVNALPGVTIDAYQTNNELEIKEIRAEIERTTFRYDQLKVGLVVGRGQMDVGTPPKASAEVSITCIETDARTFGVFAVRARHALASVYLSDIKIKDNDGNLQLTSISNFSRSNDPEGRHTTQFSARVQQKFDPGWFLLSSTAGELRTRVLLYSEGDPAQEGAQAMKVLRQSVWLNP
jgi:hypothetical protein